MFRKVLCLLFCAGIGISSAETLKDSEKLDRIRADIDAVKNKLQQINVQRSSLNEQLADLESRYGFTAGLLRDLKRQVDIKNGRLTEIRRNIQNYQVLIARLGKELSGHIRAAYVMGREEKLKMLLNQQDPALSSRIMVYHSYLNKIRLQQLAAFQEAALQLDRLNRDELTEAAQLEQDLDKKKQEQNELDGLRRQRTQLLERLANDLSSSEMKLSQLIESEAKLTSLIEDLHEGHDQSEETKDADYGLTEWTEWFTDSREEPDNLENQSASSDDSLSEPPGNIDFSSLKGKLPWPVKGKIRSPMKGNEVESIRDGVLIDAGEGAEIQAVTAGKVVYAEWLRGYGLLMIIDHGQGYMTLYAFNQSLYKKAGERVRTGEVIASVGQSGGRSASGLYFGIRKNKKAVDPLEWCRKDNQG